MALRLLDTNIVSYFFKRHRLAAKYAPHIAGHVLVLSFMTPAELIEGGLRAQWSAQRFAQLQADLQKYSILHSSADICHRWGEVRYERRAQPISVDDAWIAATALVEYAELAESGNFSVASPNKTPTVTVCLECSGIGCRSQPFREVFV